jgi:hypothetical protein
MKPSFVVLDTLPTMYNQGPPGRPPSGGNNLLLWCFVCLFPCAAPAQADSVPGASSHITINAGAFSVFNPARTRGQVECEFYPNLRIWFCYGYVGAFVTTNSSASVFAGLTIPIRVKKHFLVRLSFAPGLYTSMERKSDLGYLLEFRTSLKMAYVFRNDSRLGIQFSHISNANLNRWNPGAEVLVISWEIPFRLSSPPSSSGEK